MCCNNFFFRFIFFCAWVICLVGKPTSLFAQNTLTSPGVHMTACVKKGQILLRWSPTTSIAWQYAMKYGYTLQRITLVRNGKLVPPNAQSIVSQSFKTASQQAFKTTFQTTKDSMVAVGLQAAFGQTFEAKSQNPNIYEAIEKTKEIEQRFVFSMYAATLSRNTAQLMGVFHADSHVVAGEKYLYRVFIPLPNAKERLDTGAVFADVDNLTEYPKNRSLKAVFTKNKVKLNWEFALHRSFFSSYIVERSEDGVNFVSITARPYASLVENPNNTLMYYVDSLPSVNKRYYFRVCGRTYFGENGPYTNIVYGSGKEPLPEAPRIVSLIEPAEQKVKVEWSLPVPYNRLVREFQIHIAPAPGKKSQKTIISDVTQRSVILPAPFPSNYISIVAIGTDSVTYGSPQSLFQLKDITPPAMPSRYKAKIDTNGALTITWAKNKEPDIYGYRVFYANALHEEFIQPHPIIFKDTVYRDTLPLYNLTNKIYYKLLALDYHYNPSQLTPPIEVKKPDKMPPSIPVFFGVISTSAGVALKWYNSNSADVIQHILYRREENALEWITIAKFDTIVCPKGKACNYLDVAASRNEEKNSLRPSNKIWYQYSVRALDENGNYSPYSEIIRSKPLDLKIAEPITGFTATADVEAKMVVLSWKHPDAVRMLVYRKMGDESLSHYYTVEKSQTFSDKSLQLNTAYAYRIRGVLNDGSLTPFSEVVQVNY